ncbi:NAD-dependent epimerase/dehydratase family protein [Pseudomonas fluorescens]|nr:NAD-dependent epimerase/dehydratase family protein [Pseudomonas fluorescens]
MSDAVVVLGGAGLVGSLISRILMQYGYDVRVVDRRSTEHERGFNQIDVMCPFSNTEQIFKGAVAVVFALPESVAIHAIPWVVSSVSKNVVFIPPALFRSRFTKH